MTKALPAPDLDPILNDPYQEPEAFYRTDHEGKLDYDQIVKGQRPFSVDLPSIPDRAKGKVGVRPGGLRTAVLGLGESGAAGSGRVAQGRIIQRHPRYPRPRVVLVQRGEATTSKLFFAQREAIETAIYLNEVAQGSNPGQNILRKLREQQLAVSDDTAQQLPRIAFKMATGTGKTVVMAALILYHYLNRREYRGDVRFADYFLIIAPGITIRDRLGVLRVEAHRNNKQKSVDYYTERSLVPPQYNTFIDGLNAHLVITNYHAFMPRTLQGNKKSPFDGKIGADGKKSQALESFDQVVKRVMSNLKPGRRLLVLNDEAHHCYRPKSETKANTDFEEHDENERAAVWFTGLTEIAQRYKLTGVYDLSATPYYLKGSGYVPYALRLGGQRVRSYRSHREGLVKIPYLPIADDTQELTEPVLKNLYEHTYKQLPRKGQKKEKSLAKKEGRARNEELPDMPPLVKGALDQFHQHYNNYEKGQVSDEFRKVFAAEIAEFKKEYARLYGQGAADEITDGELLREVVNTVGKPGKLGAHIRCVVSVSMLTEGWDANTVTHIMGLRAFGSQLLCEQVAGRALRRREYFLQGYDKDGQPTNEGAEDRSATSSRRSMRTSSVCPSRCSAAEVGCRPLLHRRKASTSPRWRSDRPNTRSSS
ncbi:MAG: DEAD/DEAH box helicase family protein [Flavobacteriales bacterium]|nr:DEAD/DEAH box helicase family protein [Flavobacteriales bacterium]